MPGSESIATSGGREITAPFQRIAIVGFGLIGGSLGLAIKARWPTAIVIAVDRPEVVQTARRMGAADDGASDLTVVAGADLVVLAAPVGINIRTLGELPQYVSGDAIVTDVGSTKRETVAAAAALPARLRFIGGHPVAGAATSGVAGARADLFSQRPWVLTPAGDHERELARLTEWIESLGATVRRLTPEAHDALVGILSHLPQLTATALMHVVGERSGDEALALAGRGLRDTTRLASSRAEIWRDIARTNRDNIGAAIDALVGVLLEMKADLDGHSGALERTFESAAVWKAALERHFAHELTTRDTPAGPALSVSKGPRTE